MGKHERALIEEAEKIIVKILNCFSVGEQKTKNHWFRHARSVAEKIKKDFPRISSASHLGNRYDNTGDISIISAKKKLFLEIKMSDTKSGVGTKANVSQNALTDNHLFDGNVKSWSGFRKDKKHDIWVNNYLDRYSNYPKKIVSIKNPTRRKEEKARYLRELSKKGNNKKIKVILDSISNKDKREKIDYLNYLRAQKQSPEMIKNFLVLITLGIHNQDVLGNLMNKKDLLTGVKNLIVYYANSYKKDIVVKKEDIGEKITKILKKYSEFKIIFPSGLTYCKIVGVRGEINDPLLGIVFHWKNIAQGIKTPCLNIFDLVKNG